MINSLSREGWFARRCFVLSRRGWGFIAGGILLTLACAAEGIPEGVRPLQSIRSDHPRLFISADDLPALRASAYGPAREEYDRLRKTVDALPPEAPMVFQEERFTRLPDGTIQADRASRHGQHLFRYNGGDQAAQAALLYLIDGRKTDLEKAKNYLRLAGEVILWSAETAERWVAWQNHVELNALAAYDWIHNDLTPDERRELLLPLLDYVTKAQPGGEYTFRRTIGSHRNGNYGVRALQWFAGVAAYGDGIDDERASDLLKSGAELFFKMLDHREAISAGSGLLASPTVSYSFGPYPDATFLFFYSWHAAFGQDLSGRWTQMADYANWFDWSAIRVLQDRPMFLHYGIGDIAHRDNLNSVRSLYTHFAQVIHFYRDRFPEKAEHAYAQVARLPETARGFRTHYPFVPFLVAGFDPSRIDSVDSSAVSSGRYFHAPRFGLFHMRSGTGPDDTYIAFRGGSSETVHQHYDELSFVIYKRNFLALDAGSRTNTAHHHKYAAQSVAHNTLLIHQPGEEMPPFWRPWGYESDGKTYYNHGGQNDRTAAKTIAVQSTDDFIYVAADATGSYASSKSREVVRQFVYLLPDVVVVYDRVESVNPEQHKEFLLHAQNKPRRLGETLWQIDFDGRLFVQTILPADPRTELAGGPGNEFYASGRNWPVVEPETPDWDQEFQLTGKWRLEISDPEPASANRFLHVLEATLPEYEEPLAVEHFQTSQTDGVRFTDRAGIRWELKFNRTGEIGLHLEQVNADGSVRFSGVLVNEVESPEEAGFH